jgi:hypothetical protein
VFSVAGLCWERTRGCPGASDRGPNHVGVVVGHVCHFVAIMGYEDAGRLALELAAGDGVDEVMLPQRNEVAIMV